MPEVPNETIFDDPVKTIRQGIPSFITLGNAGRAELYIREVVIDTYQNNPNIPEVEFEDAYGAFMQTGLKIDEFPAWLNMQFSQV